MAVIGVTLGLVAPVAFLVILLCGRSLFLPFRRLPLGTLPQRRLPSVRLDPSSVQGLPPKSGLALSVVDFVCIYNIDFLVCGLCGVFQFFFWGFANFAVWRACQRIGRAIRWNLQVSKRSNLACRDLK